MGQHIEFNSSTGSMGKRREGGGGFYFIEEGEGWGGRRRGVGTCLRGVWVFV
jgi:hypothetical protein